MKTFDISRSEFDEDRLNALLKEDDRQTSRLLDEK